MTEVYRDHSAASDGQGSFVIPPTEEKTSCKI